VNLYRWVAVGLAALAGGCATPWAVESFAAPEADLPGMKSFVWKGGAFNTPAAMPAEVAATVEPRVRQAVVDELLRKGFVEVTDPAGADMLVSVQVSGTRRFVLSEEPRVGAPSPAGVLTASGMPLPPASELPREQTVRDGSVVVFVEDPATGRIIWRGLVTAETRVTSREAGTRMVVDMARRIAQDFPARRPAN
jgi:Domain of unknown function (DUF4136)